MSRGQGFLHHGVDRNDALVSIDAVDRGRTELVCPYCATGLLAKKGRILAPLGESGPSLGHPPSIRRLSAALPYIVNITLCLSIFSSILLILRRRERRKVQLDM